MADSPVLVPVRRCALCFGGGESGPSIVVPVVAILANTVTIRRKGLARSIIFEFRASLFYFSRWMTPFRSLPINEFTSLLKKASRSSREVVLANFSEKVLPEAISTSPLWNSGRGLQSVSATTTAPVSAPTNERIDRSTQTVIIGSVVGVVTGGLLLMVAIIVYVRRRKNNNNAPVTLPSGEKMKHSRIGTATMPEGSSHVVPYATPAPPGPTVVYKNQCHTVVKPPPLPSTPLRRPAPPVVRRSDYSEERVHPNTPVAVAVPMPSPIPPNSWGNVTVGNANNDDDDAYSA